MKRGTKEVVSQKAIGHTSDLRLLHKHASSQGRRDGVSTESDAKKEEGNEGKMSLLDVVWCEGSVPELIARGLLDIGHHSPLLTNKLAFCTLPSWTPRLIVNKHRMANKPATFHLLTLHCYCEQCLETSGVAEKGNLIHFTRMEFSLVAFLPCHDFMERFLTPKLSLPFFCSFSPLHSPTQTPLSSFQTTIPDTKYVFQRVSIDSAVACRCLFLLYHEVRTTLASPYHFSHLLRIMFLVAID